MQTSFAQSRIASVKRHVLDRATESYKTNGDRLSLLQVLHGLEFSLPAAQAYIGSVQCEARQ
jgi:hypothetical protein